MACYLFNFTRKEAADESRPHREQAAELLGLQMWGIGPKAANRELLSPGDQILIYVGSEFLFIGTAVLSSGVHEWTPEEAALYPGSHKEGVGFRAFAVWKMPVPLRSAALARAGGMPSFGGESNPQLFGSVLPIEQEDFDRVVSLGASQSARMKPPAPTMSSDTSARATPSEAAEPTIPSEATGLAAVTDEPEAPAASPIADLSAPAEAPETESPTGVIPSDAPARPSPDDEPGQPVPGEVSAQESSSGAPTATAVSDQPATPAAAVRLFDWRAGDVWVEPKPAPEVSARAPEISPAAPEISRPEPEISTPVPDVSAPESEIAAPEPEIAAPEPEIFAPEPEISPPAPVTEESATVAAPPTTADRLYDVAERLNRFLAGPADQLSEEATRAHFVTPFLVALGYTDFSDIAFGVPVESGAIADYVVSATDEPTIVVEARKLGTPLEEQEAAQVVEDASALGVRWGMVTDGRQIKVFDAHAPNVEPEERLVFEVDLGDYSDREDFDAQIYPDLALLAKSEMQEGGEGLATLAAELDRTEEASAALIAKLVEEHLEQTFRLQLVANLRDIFEGRETEGPMSVPARRAAQEAIRELLTSASSSSVGELRRELKAKKLIHLSAEETTELIAELIRRTPVGGGRPAP